MNLSSTTTTPRQIAVPSAELVAPPPELTTLTNGRYKVRFSSVGSGYSERDGVAVSRWGADTTQDADGFYFYLRDLDDQYFWSAGYQPTRVVATHYQYQAANNAARITRLDREIECQTTVMVWPTRDLEIRTCQLTNRSARPRLIELTSYLEWVLTSRASDASHPAFSKLFVETSFSPEWRAILARRRPRHSGESELWGFHALVTETEDHFAMQFETNRMRFIGRGRSLARPRALDPGTNLSGDTGPVLDPIASLRVALALAPGEARQVAFILGVAATRSEAEELLATVRSVPRDDRMWSEVEESTKLSGNGHRSAESASLSPVSRRLVVHPPHGPSADGIAPSKRERTFVPATLIPNEAPRPASKREPLLFENGYGGFTMDGREYVLRLQADGRGSHRRPPLPWANVVANEHAGFLVTESGAGYTWVGNSRENRTTAWHNDPVLDPHSEAYWIRDEDAGVFWSAAPGPTPAAVEYVVRHGFGYTTFAHESHDLSHEMTLFVPRDEPVKLVRLRLTNLGHQRRRLSLFSYLQWALGNSSGERGGAIATEYDAEHRTIWASNPQREHYGGCSAFSAVVAEVPTACRHVSFSCDRASFLGQYGDLEAPAALVNGEELDRRSGNGLDPCAAWQLAIELSPGESFECSYLLGETTDHGTAVKLIEKYRERTQVQQALDDVRNFWRQTLSAIQIETPHREIDLMVNGWLAYQNLSCRIWARSAYYQPGGAFGYRDQLQDSAALVYHRPELSRIQILRNAAQQFVEGDVLHWWHPDTGYGLRTRFSDDLLWLPYLAAEYVLKTGDEAVLDEMLPFIIGPPLAEGQQESFLRPSPSGELGTLYEHCCRALDRGLTTGPRGLPLIGCGDWNDGFSRVGWQGRGESVWLGFFIDHVLDRMLPICRRRGDEQRVARYSAYRGRLREALHSAGWDGAWYRRAYYDNGQPIGSALSDECQIDALVQAWAVISGVAPPHRARAAMNAVESRLIDNHAGIIRLLTPPFNRTPNDPGYIKGYLPGIRENGGQYTHGVLWVVRAMAELGRGTRAVELLRMLSPVFHTSSTELVSIYQTEPYVVAADVYGESPHVGRGGWTWYTGSAGWMLRVAVESIFGFTTEGGHTLVINPCISSAWPRCRLTYRLPDGKTRYDITIENPTGNERGVREATLDDQSIEIQNGVARIPIQRDEQLHRVIVRL